MRDKRDTPDVLSDHASVVKDSLDDSVKLAMIDNILTSTEGEISSHILSL